MFTDVHCYIDLDWEYHLSDAGVDYLRRLHHLVETLRLYKVSLFYSEKQIRNFKDYLKDELDDNGVQSIGNQLDLIIQNAQNKKECAHVFQLLYAEANTCIQEINHPLIQSVEVSPNVMVASLSLDLSAYRALLRVESDICFDRVTLHSIKHESDVHAYIQAKQVRTFNLSKKHGENGKGNQKGQSCLLCSTAEAQELLNTAIPDLRQFDNRLFNYDEKHCAYIEFFFEGENPQHQWHGFHVDKELENRIPDSIKRILVQNHQKNKS